MRAEFCVKKVIKADLTIVIKKIVARYEELTPKTHSLPTLDPTWTTKLLSISSLKRIKGSYVVPKTDILTFSV